MVTLRNSNEGYGLVALTLHWVLAGLIVVQILLGLFAADLPVGMQRLVWLSRHKSIGMTILVLMIVRLAWRLLNRPPPLPAQIPGYEQSLARLVHWLIYLLLLSLPLAGWITTSASNLTMSWFGVVTLPDIVEPDQSLAATAATVHAVLAWVLSALVVLHVLAALRHHFIRKNAVLARMVPWLRRPS